MLFLDWHVDIDETSSPVAHLLPNVVNSLALIAPERTQQLAGIASGLSVKISDSREFKCEALPGLNVIHLTTRVVELAWVFSFAYWELYRGLLSGRTPDGSVIDPRSAPELDRVLPLLSWGLAELTSGEMQAWPPNSPKPSVHVAQESAELVADELALCSLAMYLHHELAHVYAPRDQEMTGREEEEYCDAAAADWILSTSGLEPAIVQKRGMGVAIGMLMLTARGIASRSVGDGVHPPGYERLLDALITRVPEDQDGVWGLVTGMLAFHISSGGIPPHSAQYDDFRAAAIGYADHIRHHLAISGDGSGDVAQ